MVDYQLQPMFDASIKKKRGAIGEEDVCILLQRYKPEQVLALLREVAQSPGLKIDWNAVVKKPEIEIASPRECQMLWRHLAYLHPLTDEIGDAAHPLDDDSDLEYELEPSPSVSIEFATEVGNYVKVLAAGSSNESSMPNNSVIKGDMLNSHSSKISSETQHPTSLLHYSNINHPVSAKKQPQTAVTSAEAFDANGLDSKNPKKKRKQWSSEEDLRLIAAVKKFGEGNWASMVKDELKWRRTASQLAQRWAIIRKKQGTLGGTSPQLSEAQLATRRAIDMALKDNLTGSCSTAGNGAATNSTLVNLNSSNGETPTAGSTISSQPQSSQVPRLPLKQAPTNTIASVSDSIQAAAVAAGARIASPSDAATLFKAVQSKNAVHIIGGSSLIKSSGTASSPLPPNVHFIRTGLVANTATSMAAGTSTNSWGQQAKASAGKPAASHISKATGVPSTGLDRRNSAPSISAGVPQQMDKTLCEVKIPVSDNVGPSRYLPKSQGTLSDPGNKRVDVDNSQCAMSKDMTKSECKNPAENEKQSTVQGSCDVGVNGRTGSSLGSAAIGHGVNIVAGVADKSDKMDITGGGVERTTSAEADKSDPAIVTGGSVGKIAGEADNSDKMVVTQGSIERTTSDEADKSHLVIVPAASVGKTVSSEADESEPMDI